MSLEITKTPPDQLVSYCILRNQLLKISRGFFWFSNLETHQNWLMVWNIFCFHPYLGKWSNLTNIFQRGWNHQLEKDIISLSHFWTKNVSSLHRLLRWQQFPCSFGAIASQSFDPPGVDLGIWRIGICLAQKDGAYHENCQHFRWYFTKSPEILFPVQDSG